MPATSYFAAPELRFIGDSLIKEHHTHLRDVRIEYFYRSKAGRSAGKLIFGKARKVSGLSALLATPESMHDPEDSSEGLDFFVVEVAFDLYQLLTHAQQRALIDHELSHLTVEMDDEGEFVLSIRGHEIEEFAGVVNRHGLYLPDIANFFRAIDDDKLSLWAEMIPEDAELFANLLVQEGEGEVIEGPWTGTDSF